MIAQVAETISEHVVLCAFSEVNALRLFFSENMLIKFLSPSRILCRAGFPRRLFTPTLLNNLSCLFRCSKSSSPNVESLNSTSVTSTSTAGARVRNPSRRKLGRLITFGRFAIDVSILQPAFLCLNLLKLQKLPSRGFIDCSRCCSWRG